MGQESGSGLAEWLGLRVSYELVLKLSCEAGESTSKLIHMAIGKP